LAELSCKTLTELQKIKGIGEAKAIIIIAALEISRRREAEQPIEKARILSSADAAHLIQPLIAHLPYETFNVMHLSRNNTLLKTEQISKGGVSGTVVDAKIIFKSAIESLASGLILCHNHPSGNLAPSETDIKLTHDIIEGLKLLDIQVFDHLILVGGAYTSMVDEGLIRH
jgi:DNA repair protein RadC